MAVKCVFQEEMRPVKIVIVVRICLSEHNWTLMNNLQHRYFSILGKDSVVEPKFQPLFSGLPCDSLAAKNPISSSAIKVRPTLWLVGESMLLSALTRGAL